MRRSRQIAADPARDTRETWDAIVALVTASLPAVPSETVASDLQQIASFVKYLISTEALADMPLTLCAGTLACDIFAVYGSDALSLEEPNAPPGAARATNWHLYVPIPEGAPFSERDLRAAGARFNPGPAPPDPSQSEHMSRAVRLDQVVDADALRKLEE
jgi:hypothetical protein